MDKELVQIDKDNMLISVAGRERNSNKIHKGVLSIDYRNKKITVHYPNNKDVFFSTE